MAFNRFSGMGYTGFSALIFIEMNQYGAKEETYEEMRRRQHKLYAYLRAHLPELYDKESKRAEYNGEVGPLLDEAATKIEDCRQLYKPQFEGMHTWTEEEMDFQIALDSSFEHLCMIAAKTKVIDKQKMGDDSEVIG